MPTASSDAPARTSSRRVPILGRKVPPYRNPLRFGAEGPPEFPQGGARGGEKFVSPRSRPQMAPGEARNTSSSRASTRQSQASGGPPQLAVRARGTRSRYHWRTREKVARGAGPGLPARVIKGTRRPGRTRPAPPDLPPAATQALRAFPGPAFAIPPRPSRRRRRGPPRPAPPYTLPRPVARPRTMHPSRSGAPARGTSIPREKMLKSRTGAP